MAIHSKIEPFWTHSEREAWKRSFFIIIHNQNVHVIEIERKWGKSSVYIVFNVLILTLLASFSFNFDYSYFLYFGLWIVKRMKMKFYEIWDRKWTIKRSHFAYFIGRSSMFRSVLVSFCSRFCLSSGSVQSRILDKLIIIPTEIKTPHFRKMGT